LATLTANVYFAFVISLRIATPYPFLMLPLLNSNPTSTLIVGLATVIYPDYVVPYYTPVII